MRNMYLGSMNNVDQITLSFFFQKKSRKLEPQGQAYPRCSPVHLLVVPTSGDYLYAYVYQRKTPNGMHIL